MVDLWRDFWIHETGMGQQVAQLHDRYMMMMMMMITIIITPGNKRQNRPRNWIQHVNRMPRNRLPRVMKHYCPTDRRNHGRLLNRLLDTWEWNGLTSGPTPWKIFDDDDDDDDDDDYDEKKFLVLNATRVSRCDLNFSSARDCEQL